MDFLLLEWGLGPAIREAIKVFWGWKLAVRGPQEKGVATHAPRGAYTSKNFFCS